MGRIIDEVGHFKGVDGGVIEFFGRTFHEPVDQEFVPWFVGGGEDPGLPVGIVVVFAHEVFFNIKAVRYKVADIAPFAVADRANGVGWTFGKIIVHAEGVIPVLVALSQQDIGEGGSVERWGGGCRAGEFEKGWENVGILHDGFGSLSGRNPTGPAGDQRGVEAVVPVGPFASGELGTLFAGEEDEGVFGEIGFIQELEKFADLGIHVGDFGEIPGEVFASHGSIRQVRRKLEVGSWISGGIAHDPGGVGFGEGYDEAEGLGEILSDEVLGPGEVMGFGGVVDTVGVEAGDGLKGEGLLRFNVSLACQTNAIAHRAEMMGNAFGIGPACSVVPGAAVPKGVSAGVEFGAAGGAHRHAKVGIVEGEGLSGERVQVGSFGILAAIEGEIGEGTIVGDNDEDIRLLRSKERKSQ